MSIVGELATVIPKGVMRQFVGAADDGARYAELLGDLGRLGDTARPVVIQGGYSTSGYMYEAMEGMLKARGFRDVTATSLPLHGFAPFKADARALAKTVAAASERSIAAGGDGRVTVLAHSKGGLTSRLYLQQLDGLDHVDQLITLGTPHNGVAPLGVRAARMSALMPSLTASRQLLSGSRIIKSLNRDFEQFMVRARATNPEFRVVSIAGDAGGLFAGSDNLVSTAAARLDDRIAGASNLVFRGEGANHLAIAGQTGAFEPTLRATTLLAAGRPLEDAARGASYASIATA